MTDEMKRELNGLRAEMGAMRDDLRRDMSEIRSMFRRTMIHVAGMTGDIAGIRHELSENVAKKSDISMLYNHMDDFAGFRKDAVFNESKNVHRLDENDDRLRKLEDLRAEGKL